MPPKKRSPKADRTRGKREPAKLVADGAKHYQTGADSCACGKLWPCNGEPKFYGAVDEHNHAGGWVGCVACQAEHTAERVGGLAWTQFLRDIMTALGAVPAPDDSVNLRRVAAMGFDLQDAKHYWVQNFSGAAYVKLRPKLRLPPSERMLVWDGMAPCGKHGADYAGQQCTICPRTVVRLFDDTTEVCTPLGQQISMAVRGHVKDALARLHECEPEASLRDFEMLFVSSVQMEVARAIVLRRRPS